MGETAKKKMKEEMKKMLKECIEKDLSFQELVSILKPLSWIMNDRISRDNYIQIRFLEDNAMQREKWDERIKFFEDAELEDREDAESVLRTYKLNYDVDELL